MATIAQMQAENFSMAMRDGPRLRYDYNTWVEAKDTESNQVLIGGLGGLGVGVMWFPMSDRDEKRPGFDTAPEMDAPPLVIYRDEIEVSVTTGKRVCQMTSLVQIQPGLQYGQWNHQDGHDLPPCETE